MTNGLTVSPVRNGLTHPSHRLFGASSLYAWSWSLIVPKKRSPNVARVSMSSHYQLMTPGCGTAWRFNAWGGKVPEYAENARLARRVLSLAGAPAYPSSLCLEGGAIHTD